MLFPKCGYLHHRHFFHPFITKQLPVVYMYTSILFDMYSQSVNSDWEYRSSNVCQVFFVFTCVTILNL